MSNNNRPVIVYLNGGLGNQLFGAAFAYSLKKNLNINVQISSGLLKDRALEIDKLSISELVEIVDIELPLRWKLMKYFKEKFQFNSSFIYTEKSFNFLDEALNRPSKKLYFGYFQSEKYFLDYKNEIRNALVLRNPSIEYETLREQFESQNVLVLHVRRGDYMFKQEYHGLASENYFKRALELVSLVDSNLKLAVFSEDKQYCEKIFPNAWKVITPAELKCPVETLLLMSMHCKFIGSNSSFSWWVAFLGNQNFGDVYFPRPWFKDKSMSEVDLLHPTWISIGND